MSKQLILCDCLGSQSVDAAGVSDCTGLSCSKVFNALCTEQLSAAADLIATENVIIACQQERQRFEALAEELEVAEPGFVDLRDRAGWSEDSASKLPKMAALAAEAVVNVPNAKSLDVISEGMCLILGPAETALKAADDLCEILNVTVLVQPDDLAVLDAIVDRRFDIVIGQLKRASGAFGAFQVHIDALQQRIPGGRSVQWTEPRNGGISECDVLLDLSGNDSLFPAPEKREGYLRADPARPVAVSEVTMQASQMVGTFEKPLYVALEPTLCAHSRAEQTGCSNCLNICPTGAITPNGDHVVIDPMVCAGCGSCAALCPSGAITYDAPPVSSIFRRVQVLASTYRKAGGETPRLLVHDADFGNEMISLAARFGRGLPADVIPLEVSAIAGFGHAEALAALACGFGAVDVLMPPRIEREALDKEIALAVALGGQVRGLEPNDPDALCEMLFDSSATKTTEPVLPMGSRRQVARMAAKALNPDAETVALPEGAPYGAVVVDTDACTLCLSCVSLCPSGALGDNPDLPQLRFQEDACLQCGLCTNICPETAITLEPRMDLTDAAMSQRILNEEEPFACIECGALFGVKSTVEKIVEKLAGKHSMFASGDAAKMIQMCDTCRINAQYHSENNPFAAGERPRVRTTDDYLSKRKDH